MKQTASETDILKAYRKKVKEYHPDKVASLGVELKNLAELKMKQINKALKEGLKAIK